MQSILLVHRFHICEFIYLLKFICNAKSILGVLLLSFAIILMHRAAKNFSCRTFTFPAEIKQGITPPSCFSSHTVNVSFLQFI